MPTNTELIAQLKNERATVAGQREAFEQSVADATKRLSQIDTAIEALGGEVQRKLTGPTATEIVEAAARAVSAGQVFDNAALKRMATTMYPHMADKIKTGIYTAVNALLKKKKLIRAAGGFAVAPL